MSSTKAIYMREYMRTYRQKDSYKAMHRRISSNWIRANNQKTLAHRAIKNEIRSGRMTAPEVCERCHRYFKTQAHHPDYNKPLDVMWLCENCHKEIHNE